MSLERRTSFRGVARLMAAEAVLTGFTLGVGAAAINTAVNTQAEIDNISNSDFSNRKVLVQQGHMLSQSMNGLTRIPLQDTGKQVIPEKPSHPASSKAILIELYNNFVEYGYIEEAKQTGVVIDSLPDTETSRITYQAEIDRLDTVYQETKTELTTVETQFESDPRVKYQKVFQKVANIGEYASEGTLAAALLFFPLAFRRTKAYISEAINEFRQIRKVRRMKAERARPMLGENYQ